MKLASLLNPRLIFFDLEGSGRAEIYRDLLEKMSAEIDLPVKPADAVPEMIKREDSYEITYDMGLAFPHFRHSDLSDLDIGIGILRNPVRLKASDRKATGIIICSMISESTSVIYLKFLAAFSKFLYSDPSAMDDLIRSGNPKAFIEVFNRRNIEVKHNLTAEDVMFKMPRSVHPEDKLGKALDAVMAEKRPEIPVLSQDGRLEGIIRAEDIFRKALPPYIMMMYNLDFLDQFELFENMLREEGKMRAGDVMTPPELTVRPETPLFQLTVRLAKEKASCAVVLDPDRKFLGIITYLELISNVLRG